MIAGPASPAESTKIADLDVAAASGAVITGDTLHIVADDELFLSRFGLDGVPRGRLSLLDGTLPDEHAARKAAKPDLEALVLFPDGAIVALGSGSRPARHRGARIAGAEVTALDLRPLYERLLSELPELNVEGAAVCGDTLRLLSRGNGPGRVNAVIDLDLVQLVGTTSWGAAALRDVRLVVLPDGYGFTDAEPAGGDALFFSAAAEDSVDTYEDGRVAGSVLGVLDGATPRLVTAISPLKIEGLARHAGFMYLVTDADDRDAPAALLRTSIPAV